MAEMGVKKGEVSGLIRVAKVTYLEVSRLNRTDKWLSGSAQWLIGPAERLVGLVEGLYLVVEPHIREVTGLSQRSERADLKVSGLIRAVGRPTHEVRGL